MANLQHIGLKSIFSSNRKEVTLTVIYRFNVLCLMNKRETGVLARATGIRMSGKKYSEDDPKFGSMVLATSWKDATYTLRWERPIWWDDVQSFWRDFSEDGRLAEEPSPDPSIDGETDVGSLGLLACAIFFQRRR